MSAAAAAEDYPLFRIVKGSPSAEEIAALTVVLSALRAPGAPTDPPTSPTRGSSAARRPWRRGRTWTPSHGGVSAAPWSPRVRSGVVGAAQDAADVGAPEEGGSTLGRVLAFSVATGEQDRDHGRQNAAGSVSPHVVPALSVVRPCRCDAGREEQR
ncbi:MAG TPA: acyl-CoA carboxylase subunit epsilon [Propionibacteriaceae bacterium]|nr:acyl-CoA carboxylase subunit epsilon [Propionibacteriaceae bacterium]